MVNSPTNSNTTAHDQQHNNSRSVLLYDPEERIKNADRLAKSLKTYLNTSPIKKKRGPQKDARICQLNAAYKYIIHLEDKLTTICNAHNQLTPDDCKLVHNTNANLSYRHRLQNSDMTPNTPSQRNLIHESSTLSGSAASSSPKISLNSKKTPMCSSSSSSSSRSSSTTNMMPLKNLINFENIDASPILGNENHFFGEIENFTEFESNIQTSSAQSNFKSPRVNSRKRKLTDLNTPVISNDFNNNSKPCSSKSLQMPGNSCQNLEDDSVGRKHYFLRSTNRLKNMLIANNPVSQKQQSEQDKTTLVAIKKLRQSSTKKSQYNRIFDSSLGSTRSTSVATTPSVPNSNMSTNSSNEFDQNLNTIETKHLIKLNLSQDQVAQLYESNQKENLSLKKTFNFV